MGRWRCKERAVEGPKGDQGGGAWAERTRNMDSMVVTLAVLKLSGWLNSSAFCPAKGRAFKVGGMCAWRCERVGWLPCEERAGEGPKGDQGVRGTGRAAP